ncbi:MAG TPA: hypothetical protein VFH95_05080 [Candidatus Kapabacteria bacterium]|nr:hypothetical protein [Candidatus Kapabacteria bacterium]
MTKILLLLTFALCSRALQPMVTEHFTNTTVAMAPTGTDSCYTFTVDNESTDTLGEVTVSGATDYTDFYITGSGQYQKTLCYTAVSVTIAGVTVPYPNLANIPLPNGAWVKAGWQSPSLVEVVNETGQDTPAE